jgi:hypothetical protein
MTVPMVVESIHGQDVVRPFKYRTRLLVANLSLCQHERRDGLTERRAR